METTRTRLALDLGSTSLGWALFRLNEQHEPTAIIKAGVRIFSDGRNPKDGASLAVTRREARSMRRRRDRLLKRKNRMMAALITHGFFPAEVSARKALESLDPYTLRDKGLREALTPAEFARALFHINQRRGFKSNRKTDKKDNDSGALKTAISHVRQQLIDSGSQTVGQWLYRRLHPTQGNSLGTRARYRETPTLTSEGKKRIDKSYDLYVDRQMIEDEFDALWAAQSAHNPAVFTEAARWTLKDTLLFQRRLRPVKPGRCTLLPEEERAPLALPSTQRFRIYQEVNHLRVLDDGLQDLPLSLAQRDAIAGALDRKAKVSFDAIRTLLKLDGSTKFNLEDAKRAELKGNATSAVLSKKELFGKAWFDFDAGLQDDIAQHLVADESEAELILWLQANTGVNEQRAQAIASVGLPEGYGSLSKAALVRILPALQADVVTYDKAVVAAGFEHHSQLGFEYDASEVDDWVHPSTGEIKPVFKQLPYYGKALQRHVAFGSGKPEDTQEKRYGKIANPTVHIGLNQVRVVVNALVRRYGRPTEVVIELARELKQSREQKRETQQRQADNQKRNERIRKSISEVLDIAAYNVKGEDIEKYKLWEDLSFDVADRKCPYSGTQISAAMLLSEQVEIEHILPFSMTLDDSMNNKTVATRLANRIKGNRTPWQARDDFAAQGWHYDGILHRAERMPLRKRYRFAADGYERWQGEDQGFLARALNDTRYLSRVATAYVSLICPQGTRVIPGQMTALLRAKLGLNQVLGLRGEKNRNDHRHHAVDACVIGITDQGMLQRFARASADARQQALGRLVADMPVPWPTYREHVARAVSHIWVSHKPDHGHDGAMMEETSYGIRKDGSIKQRRKADGSTGREITNLIRIREQGQSARHGVDAAGQDLPYKGYVGGSNYCIEITVNDKGKWEGDVISTFDAYRIVRAAGLVQLRHPTQGQNGRPLAMRLIIGDAVRLESAEGLQTMRVVKINGNNGQVFMAPGGEANVDARNSDKQDSFSYTSKYAGSLQKSKARRVTISPIGELRDPGFEG
jgi:CRISPR-associated endonuclease Csn1